MDNRPSKYKSRIAITLQLLTVILLVCSITMLFKQQKQITEMQYELNSVNGNVDDVLQKVNDLDSRLDDVENNLSSEIDDVKRSVMLWSNESIAQF